MNFENAFSTKLTQMDYQSGRAVWRIEFALRPTDAMFVVRKINQLRSPNIFKHQHCSIIVDSPWLMLVSSSEVSRFIHPRMLELAERNTENIGARVAGRLQYR